MKFFLVLVFGGVVAEGLRCWVCNSERDPRCGDKFDPVTIEMADCDQWMALNLAQARVEKRNATVCRKISQRVSLGKMETNRVVRSCGYEVDENEPEKCFNRAGTFEVMVTYCSCQGDGCNSGSHSIPNIPILSLLLATIFH